MSGERSDNASLKETQVSSVVLKNENQSKIAMKKSNDNLASKISAANPRKNTLISNTVTNPVISGPTIMDNEDATRTTIAIGNETYTIGEIKFKNKPCKSHFI